MSRTRAINDKCKDCIYDPLAGGTWREQVEMCRSEKTCALWPFRPVTTATVVMHRKIKTVDIDSLLDSIEADEDDTVAA
jgi:hypothetical protein